MHDDNLAEFAQQLRHEGISGKSAVLSETGSKGSQVGLEVAAIGFVSLWELNAPENLGYVAARDFGAIKAGRPPNWEPVERRLWSKGAKGD
jgi:hypothetical protein